MVTPEKCERHPEYTLVWCNECCRIDREAWQARLAVLEAELTALKQRHLEMLRGEHH